MTDGATNIRIEVRAGIADQPAVGFTPGEPVDPFAVGKSAAWRVDAPGVADVHAYLYFDGEAVFVSSANPQDPAWVNGQPVGTDWQPVEPGSEIMMGEASLWVDADLPRIPAPDPGVAPIRQRRPKKPPVPVQDEATVMRPMQVPSGTVPGPAPLPPRAKPDKAKLKIRQSARKNPPGEDEATRFAPIEAAKAPEVPPPAPLPPQAFKPPGVAGPPSESLPSTVRQLGVPPPPAWAPQAEVAGAPLPAQPGLQPGAAPAPLPEGLFSAPAPAPGAPAPEPGAPGPAQPPGKKKPLDFVKESWKTSSIPQKAILLMMPFAFVAMFVIFQEDDQVTEAAPPPRATASAAASAPVASAALEDRDAAPPTEQDAGTAASGPADAGTAAPAATGDESSKPPKLAKGEKTLQREAADALAAGSFAKALELYEKLAKENPENQAYAEAVRILRDRAARGEP